jgi:signal transduction histidine kinase
MLEHSSQVKTTAAMLQQLRASVNPDLGKLDGLTRAVLHKVSDGILFLDLNGKIVEANESAQKYLGVLDASGKRFWDVFPDDRLGFSMRESLRYGICHALIYRHDLEISTSFYYEWPQGLIVRIRDNSEKQKTLIVQNRTDRMRDLGEMAAKLAHEIRNCLGGIRGFASLLYRDLSSQQHLQEMVARVLEGTKSLENLVTGILVYSRPDQISVQSLDLSAHVKSVARYIQVDPIFPPNVKFRLHSPDAPFVVPFDPEALKRCLLNLLVNAVQAMPDGGELALSLFKQDAVCQITVADTGIGMSEAQLGSLFSPLFTTKKTGNGLGLMEAKKIIQAHGGTIDVRSMLGRGTTFILTLPLKRIS